MTAWIREASKPNAARAIAGTLALLAVFLLAAPAAEACPVCFQAKNDASRVAFIATTAFLTFLPLVLISAVAWWVRSRFAAAEREEAAQRSPELAVSPSH